MRGVVTPALLLAVSCSSSSPAPRARPVATADAAPAADAAPMVAVPVAADAAPAGGPPPVPTEACLPSSGYETAFDGGRARFCWSRTPGSEISDTCLWVGRDGAASIGDALPQPDDEPPTYPTVRYLDASGAEPEEGMPATSVEVCTAATQCRTITPKKPADAIVGAAIDDAGKHVAVLLQVDPLDNGTVEIYELAKGRSLAKKTMVWDDHHGVSYSIAFVGSLLLWVEYPGATEAANGSLWKVAGKKLKLVASLDGRTYEYHRAGRYVVFVGDRLWADVYDVKTGKPKRGIDLGALVPEAELEEWEENRSTMMTDADGEELLFAATESAFARVAFVNAAKGEPELVDVPRCPAQTE
jgi:hypothetical protein